MPTKRTAAAEVLRDELVRLWRERVTYPTPEALFMADGSQRGGAAHRNAFWAGYNRLHGNEKLYQRSHLSRAAWAAGRDCRREVEVGR